MAAGLHAERELQVDRRAAGERRGQRDGGDVEAGVEAAACGLRRRVLHRGTDDVRGTAAAERDAGVPRRERAQVGVDTGRRVRGHVDDAEAQTRHVSAGVVGEGAAEAERAGGAVGNRRDVAEAVRRVAEAGAGVDQRGRQRRGAGAVNRTVEVLRSGGAEPRRAAEGLADDGVDEDEVVLVCAGVFRRAAGEIAVEGDLAGRRGRGDGGDAGAFLEQAGGDSGEAGGGGTRAGAGGGGGGGGGEGEGAG